MARSWGSQGLPSTDLAYRSCGTHSLTQRPFPSLGGDSDSRTTCATTKMPQAVSSLAAVGSRASGQQCDRTCQGSADQHEQVPPKSFARGGHGGGTLVRSPVFAKRQPHQTVAPQSVSGALNSRRVGKRNHLESPLRIHSSNDYIHVENGPQQSSPVEARQRPRFRLRDDPCPRSRRHGDNIRVNRVETQSLEVDSDLDSSRRSAGAPRRA